MTTPFVERAMQLAELIAEEKWSEGVSDGGHDSLGASYARQNAEAAMGHLRAHLESASHTAVPAISVQTARMALEALELASNGLRWYQDMYPYHASSSDDEANGAIDAAIQAIRKEIDPGTSIAQELEGRDG